MGDRRSINWSKGWECLSDITNDIGYGENGYSYMLNNQGVTVAHPDKEKVLAQYNPIDEAENDESLSSLANLFEKILEEKTGIQHYSYLGNKLYAGYHPLTVPIGSLQWQGMRMKYYLQYPSFKNNPTYHCRCSGTWYHNYFLLLEVI